MAPPVDPNTVLMTGENSFIRLSKDGGKTPSDRFSHWRVLWCPAGPGHTLFARSELTDGRVQIYSDNIAVTRWLQTTIEATMQSYQVMRISASAATTRSVAADLGSPPRSKRAWMMGRLVSANGACRSVSMVACSQRATAAVSA